VPDRDSDSASGVTPAARWNARIAAAQQGDREALGQIFAQLASYLRVRACEQIDAQLQIKVSPSDVVQETLLEAHRGFDRFHGATRAELVAWIQGILSHRVQTAYRTYRGTGKRDLSREIEWQSFDQFDARTVLAAPIRTPSSHAVNNEENQRLEDTLKELSPRHEQVIRLRNELKLSFIEVALALKCSPDAAQKLWTRAINQLSEKLKHHGSDREQQQ
jgi:RNA polymerase sigma-70 factor (ECF subfamily)